MSFWDTIKKIAISPIMASHTIEDRATDLYHSVTGTPTADEKRQQQSMINDQIQSYKNQTQIAQEQIDEAKNAQDVVKRQINEKQIRALRNTYRPASGFLAASQNLTSVNDVNNKLGS